ncbi:hypothetical protein [Helicobacter pametensis]|uniref:hypothetical protein n=1 Tax=Helicobacter pametensis TaxID=95149 RepID=UPI0004812B13|nr:hypothetical protein [Helicobacter pametensis]
MESLIRFICIISLGFFVFWGCASREYFKPLEIDGKKKMSGDLPSKMIDASKYGATLKNGSVLTESSGFFKLNQGETFIGYGQGFYLTSKECNTLLIYASDQSLKASLEIPSCPVTATISGDKVAIVGSDNASYVYEISSEKEIFAKKANAALAVNSSLQAPVFYADYVFFPTLDGSIIVVNLKTQEVERSLIIDSAPFFNNVIFLQVEKDLVLAATAKRILSVYKGNTYTQEEEVRNIQLHHGKIYLSTLDGQIKEMDLTLKTLRSLKFEFASLPVFNIVQDRLYALEDGSGFLIEVDLNHFTPKIYKMGISRGKNVFLQNNKIYYDDEYLEF